MKMHLRSISLGIAALFVLSTLTNAADDKIPDLTRLKDQYSKAIEAATNPIQKKYTQELTLLQQRYTKQGNLDAALAVKTELEALSPKSSSTASKPPATQRQLKKAIVGTQWQPEGKTSGTIQFNDDGTVSRVDGSPSTMRYEIVDEHFIKLWWSSAQKTPSPIKVSEDFTAIIQSNDEKLLRIK